MTERDRLRDAIRTYQCPGCANAATCPSVDKQPLDHGCQTHVHAQMVFGAPHGIVLGVPLAGAGWNASTLPVPFNVIPLHARSFPIYQAGERVTVADAAPVLCHLDAHGNTLVRWYRGGLRREGFTTVHLGDARAALSNVPEVTVEHLAVLVTWTGSTTGKFGT